MRLLDLFCCQGGASRGYADAGFTVTGVDIAPQPHYPYEFVQANALEFLLAHGREFDLIHASPPCQAYSDTKTLTTSKHPALVSQTRAWLKAVGKPWVIENVPGARLYSYVELCGTMFGLGTYRHRLFETSFDLAQPEHPAHTKPNRKLGRRPTEDTMIQVAGHFTGAKEAGEAMGIDWMTRNGLAQAIPPAYTNYIAKQWLWETT